MTNLPMEPRGKRVGFLELFFDLVFVFAVTQIVGLLHGDHSGAGWGRAALMLWLVWWAWSQYAWAGNAIDMDRRASRVWVLLATGAMLIAAASIPTAFADSSRRGLWFALPYAVVRLVGMGLHWFGLLDDPQHRRALLTYMPIAIISPLMILAGGVAGDGIRIGLWVAALAIDVIAVLSAGRGEFRVDPAHFAERHGLFVIIALGEAVVASGATASEVGLGRDVIAALAIAFVAVSGLWWSYFDWVHHAAEERLVRKTDHGRRSTLARDLFTLGHLPIIAGTVVFAAALEDVVHHPTGTLDTFTVTAFAIGPALFLGGFVLGNLRATGQILRARLAGLVGVVLAAVLVGPRASAMVSTALVAAVVIAVVAVEATTRPRPASH